MCLASHLSHRYAPQSSGISTWTPRVKWCVLSCMIVALISSVCGSARTLVYGLRMGAVRAYLAHTAVRPRLVCVPEHTSISIAHSLSPTHSQVQALPPMPKPITTVDSKLEEFSEQLLGLDTIQKGAPLARSGTTLFNGKYGTVPVALKQAANSADSLAILLNEATTIMKLRHPNVVQVFGIWKDEMEKVFMVFGVHTRLVVHISLPFRSPKLFCASWSWRSRYRSSARTRIFLRISPNRSPKCLSSSGNNGCCRSAPSPARLSHHYSFFFSNIFLLTAKRGPSSLPLTRCLPSGCSRHAVPALARASAGAPRPEASERVAERAYGGQNCGFWVFPQS